MTADDELWAKLEEIGLEAVGVNLAKGIYGHVGNKRQLVEQWVRMKAQARIDESMREQIAVARDAADSARIAATEARRANTFAHTANRIAIAAIIIAAASAAITILF